MLLFRGSLLLWSALLGRTLLWSLLLGVLAGQGLTGLIGSMLQLENSVLIGALSWPAELMVIPLLALGVALMSALLPAWEAYRVSVFELLQPK